jgi:branched-chain amino acid transport system ATP-binding protein
MPDLLRLEEVSAGYGDSVVLDGVSLEVGEGESLALLGRNGTGKTTLLMTLMGLTRVHGGRLRWRDGDLAVMPTFRRAHAGLGWVPQERALYPSLTVEEHLTAVARPGRWTAERAYGLFPRLRERRRVLGGQLSGGEQQMLAIARALVVNPTLLLLDEPMEGLAPLIVQELLNVIRELGAEGMAMILVEQHARLALSVARSAAVLERGRVVHRSSSQELLADPARLDRLVAVS